MISMQLKQVSALFGEPGSGKQKLGELKNVSPDQRFSGVVIDSREDCEGRLFIAIRGERFDGHDYVESARQKGAVAALVETETESDLPQIIVDDCIHAMGLLANHWRHNCQATVIAITGSNGKTTVKDMLCQILRHDAPTHATLGNFNNDIGVPLTLFALSQDDVFAVLELGANHAGEIAALAKIADPEIVYVNNAALAHLAGFGSLQGVVEAKGELYEYCEPRHRAVFNLDEPASQYWLSNCRAQHQLSCALDMPADLGASWHQDDEGMSLSVDYGEKSQAVRLRVYGEHSARNALAAIAIALASGIEFHQAVQNLAAFGGVKGRLQMLRGPQDSRLIDDSYNANPGSLEAGIKVLCSLSGEAWLALGDMGELGDETEALHRKVARTARHLGVEKIFALGEMSCIASDEFGEAGYCFGQVGDMAESIRKQIHGGVNLLVKGSRSAGMDQLVACLQNPDDRGVSRHVV